MPHKNDEKMPFGKGFQQSLLRLMLNDESFLIRVSKYLKYEYFSDKYTGYFYEKIVSYYSEFEQLPTPVYFQTEIKKFKGDERQPYIKILNVLYNAKFADADAFVKKHIKMFIQSNKIKDLYENIFEAWQNKSPDEIVEVVQDGLDGVRAVNFDNDDIKSLMDCYDLVEDIQSQRNSERSMTLGIPEFDHALGGGILPGELISVYGDTNTGKSVTLVNFAARFVQRNRKVLYLYTEGKPHQPILRLVSRLCNRKVPYTHLANSNLTDEQKDLIAKVVDKYKENMMVKPFTSLDEVPTIEDVIGYCKEIYKNFKFDVLIVDYADMLTTRRKVESHRHEYKYVYLGLNRIATNFNVPVITASQVRREGNGKKRKLIRLNDTSEGYEKSRLASIIFTITRHDEDVENNTMKMLLDKNRDGAAKVLVRLNTDFPNMIIFGHPDLQANWLDLTAHAGDDNHE